MSRPVTALSELIWNSLDADATQVEVVLDETRFGSSSGYSPGQRYRVFGHDEAPILFRNLVTHGNEIAGNDEALFAIPARSRRSGPV